MCVCVPHVLMTDPSKAPSPSSPRPANGMPNLAWMVAQLKTICELWIIFISE